MIRNQWYAVLPSKVVKQDKPLGVKRLGMDLVFFRTSTGQIACLKDQCPHRGAALSGGVMRDGCLCCPFHGLRFNEKGECEQVPALGENTDEDLSVFNVTSYSVREQFGIIYLWYGDEEKKTEELPFFYDQIRPDDVYSELEDPWNSHYSRCIENQLDVVHLPFVHHNTIGRGDKTVVNGPKVLWDGKCLQTSANNEKDHGQKPKSPDQSEIRKTNLNFLFPNIWLNHVSEKIRILIYFAPVDDENTVLYIRFYSNIVGVKPIDRFIAWTGKYANKVVERQDRRVVITQEPKASSLESGEALIRGDGPIIEYRKIRAQMIRENGGGEWEKKETNEKKTKKSTFSSPTHTLSYGLFVLGAKEDEKIDACIINTAIQASSDPKELSISVTKGSATHDMIQKSGQFTVSVLSEKAPFSVFQRFGFQSGHKVNKFEDYEGYALTEKGLPYVTEGTNAYFVVRVTAKMDAGSHTIFLGEIEKMEVLSDEPSTTYTYYQNNIKPKPKKVGKTEEGQTIWRCMVCGYEYVGEELPEDFVCPICKHPADDFEKVSE